MIFIKSGDGRLTRLFAQSGQAEDGRAAGGAEVFAGFGFVHRLPFQNSAQALPDGGKGAADCLGRTTGAVHQFRDRLPHAEVAVEEFLLGMLRREQLVKRWESETMTIDITRKVPEGDRFYDWYGK